MLWIIFTILVFLWLSGLVGGAGGFLIRYWSGSLLRL